MEIQLELTSRGINSDKIAVILNGVDLGVYQQKEKDAELMNQYKLKNKFVVAYVGTHGMAHKLETIVESAERMASNRSVLFLFAGGGARAEEIKRLVEAKGLGNVLVLGRQEKSNMPAIWSLCDASIVHLKNTPLFSKVIPTKIFESFAMGLPVLIGVPKGEATALVESNNAGISSDEI